MTDSFSPLRIAVERIVRPIRGSNFRKDKMREELFAHLLDSLDQEGPAEDADEPLIERHLARLGSPDSLRRELQSTVPRLERLLCARLVASNRWSWMTEFRLKRDGESMVGYAVRMAGAQSPLYFGWAVLFVLWRTLSDPEGTGASVLWIPGFTGFCFTGVVFWLLSGGYGAKYLWDERERSAPIAVAVLSITFLTFFLLGFLTDSALGSLGIMEFDFADRIAFVFFSLLGTLLAPVVFELDRRDLRRWVEWDSLDLS